MAQSPPAEPAPPDEPPGEQAAAPGDEAAMPSSAGQAVAAPLPNSWFETRIAVEELVDSGELTAALALRDHLLALAAAEFGEDSTRIAEAHLLIADVFRKDGDHAQAEQEILRAIDAYEGSVGPMSPELIEPFMKLGENYGEAGSYSSALSAYGAARTIGRRNYGLLNEEQIEIINVMSETAEKLGQLEQAAQLQLEALILIERNYSEGSLEAIEAKYRYATWLYEHRQYEEALRIYYQIERVIREFYDDDPLMSVRLLRERSRSLRVQDSGEGVSLGTLADALEILEGMDDPPPLPMAEVLVEMGDWYVEFSRSRVPGEHYLRAWDLLGQVENGAELRQQWFDELIAISMGSLSQRDLTEDPNAPEGYVVVYYTVDTSGRTLAIEITDSEPPGFKDSAVLRLIQNARFRPRIEDGVIVPVRRASRFSFRYLPPVEQ